MNKCLAYTALLLVLSLALPACVSGLKQPPVERHYWHIEVARDSVAQAPDQAPTLRLRPLRVSPGYGGRELVYRMGDADYTTDFYNLFFATPGDMLGQSLRDWLAGAGIFAHVVEDSSLARPGLTLEGMVNALYGDFSGAEPQAVVRMQFFVVDETTRNNDIVFSADYERSVPVSAKTADALVHGLTTGVREIYIQLEADLRAELAKAE